MLLIVACQLSLFSQNEASKWQFGYAKGLDFMTNPPTPVQGSVNTLYGCASIADANGNLLFYTNGSTVWNQNHQVMAGGTWLTGNTTSGQNSIIIKQPGNTNIYYLFSAGSPSSLYYSTIDMNLAAGLGSVTVANTSLAVSLNNNGNNSNFTDRVTATKHCNGTDIWVITRDYQWSATGIQNFCAFLVTSAGVSVTPVLSAAQTISVGTGYYYGTIKVSPKGNKLGLTTSNVLTNVNNVFTGYFFEVWDFNAATGAITNPINLSLGSWPSNIPTRGYGCEFSQDGSKFYGSMPYGGNGITNGYVLQWDLCAGSPAAIAASETTVAANLNSINFNSGNPFSMQLAPNGKIYIARFGLPALDVINNPNASGAACNYAIQGQPLTGPAAWNGLPNFMTSYLAPPSPPPPPFTYSINNNVSCFTASFTASNPTLACAAMGYSINGFVWDFGDSGSGVANSSTLSSPVHVYSAPGTYTTTLNLLTACGTFTLSQPVVINGAILTVNSTSMSCANLGSATVSAQGGIGPFSFTWTPTAQTNSVATGLFPGTYTIQVLDNATGCIFSSSVTLASPGPMTGVVDNATLIPCNGIGTGTAQISLFGGSGAYNYAWNNGMTVQNTASVSNLSGGIHTVTVTDALTFCSVTQVFFVNQPPALSLALSPATPTVCAGGTVTLSALSSGGTPGASPPYTYSWTAGPLTPDYIVSQNLPGNYIYSVTSRDGNNCVVTNSISVGFIVNPTITVSSTSICPLQTGSLIANGAASYTWLPSGTTNSVLTDNPLITTVYTVTGEALGCFATPATASIVLKPVPSLTLNSNGPVCNGEALSFSSTTGSAYLWEGPLSFTSSLSAFTINPATVINSGVYSLTLTGVNSCTNGAAITASVHPTPTLSAAGSTVCVGGLLSFTVGAPAGANFYWEGPTTFTSGLQNPALTNASTGMGGNYTVTVTSAQGCSNTTIVNALVVPSPPLNVTLNSSSLCAQALNGSPNTITLTSSGANTYTLTTPSHIYNPNPSGPSSPLSLSPPYLQTGLATATLIGSNGVCSVSLTADFTIVPNPTVSVSNPTPVICIGQSFTYTSNGANSYTWSQGSGPSYYVYTSGDVAVANPSINSVFSVVGASLGCMSALQSSTMTVNPLPVIAAQNASTCIGQAALLVASGNASSYTWSPAAYLNTVNGSSVQASPPADQNYLVTGALNGCTVAVPASVRVFPLPVPGIQTSANELCLYEKVNFFGSGGNSYLWTGPENVALIGQQVSFTAMNMNQSGSFTLTVTDKLGCKNSTSIDLLIKQLPTAALSGRRDGCAPFCTSLNVSGPSSLSYTWSVNQQQVNSPQLNYCFESPGTYSVYASLKDAISTCSNTIVYAVQVSPKPKADFDFSPNNPVEGFDDVLFSNTSQGEITSSRWFFVRNGGYNTNIQNPSYLFANAGNYPVALVVTNAQGCKDTVVKSIQVEPDLNIYVPSAFTPNEDGKNEVFKPVGRNLTEYKLLIFDRWGELVFETNDQLSGWDGFFKGQPAKSDVYVWQIHFAAQNGKAKQMNGHVTLYR